MSKISALNVFESAAQIRVELLANAMMQATTKKTSRDLLALTMRLLRWMGFDEEKRACFAVIFRQEKIDQARHDAVHLDEQSLGGSEVDFLAPALDDVDDSACDQVGLVDRHSGQIG